MDNEMELAEKVANCHQMIMNGEKPIYKRDSYCSLLVAGSAVTCEHLNTCPSQEEATELGGTGFYPCSAYQKKTEKK